MHCVCAYIHFTLHKETCAIESVSGQLIVTSQALLTPTGPTQYIRILTYVCTYVHVRMSVGVFMGTR